MNAISSYGGSVNSVSLAERRQQIFNKADADQSGGISFDEFSAGLPAVQGSQSGRADQAQTLFKKLDGNGDGSVDKAESETAFKQLESQLQQGLANFRLGGGAGQSGGGFQPPGGFGPQGFSGAGGLSGPPSASQLSQQLLKKVDGDKDGRFSLDDLKKADSGQDASRLEDLFSQLDADSDGSVDENEATTGFESLQKQFETQLKALSFGNQGGGNSGADTNADLSTQLQNYIQQALTQYAQNASGGLGGGNGLLRRAT